LYFSLDPGDLRLQQRHALVQFFNTDHVEIFAGDVGDLRLRAIFLFHLAPPDGRAMVPRVKSKSKPGEHAWR